MPFEKRTRGDAASAYDCFAIIPADSDLPNTIVGVYVGVSGNVVIKTPTSGATVTFLNVPQGTVLPVRAVQVRAATSATNLIGLY